MRRIRRNQVLVAAAIGFACIQVSHASIVFDVQVASASNSMVVMGPHLVYVLGTGTINFDVYAEVSNGGAPDSNDGFQSVRGYVQGGLVAGSGSVAGNNGPEGNLSNGVMVAPFNAQFSVGPPGSGANFTTTAAIDLNGNGFTDYGSLTPNSTTAIIPFNPTMVLNSNNGGSSNFKFFSFSMLVSSSGGGSTNVAFTSTDTGITVKWQEAGAIKAATNGTVGPSIPTVLAVPFEFEKNHVFLSNAAIYSSPSFPSVTAGGSPDGVAITPSSVGSIVITSNTPNPGLVEILLHTSKNASQLSTVGIYSGTMIDLTANGLDGDAQLLAGAYPWANVLLRFPDTTDLTNGVFNFDFSFAGANIDRIAAVPEPASMFVLMIGTLPLVTRRRKFVIRR